MPIVVTWAVAIVVTWAVAIVDSRAVISAACCDELRFFVLAELLSQVQKFGGKGIFCAVSGGGG